MKMSLDEIMDLVPGPEMDMLIAEEVMGWKVEYSSMDEEKKYLPAMITPEGRIAFVHFSTDWNAAGIIANKLGIALIPQSRDDGFSWYACDVESVHYRGEDIAIRERNDSGISAPTGPEAIGKASLLAMKG